MIECVLFCEYDWIMIYCFFLSELNKDRMMEILEDRGLSFLFPLMRIQAELSRQIRADPNATVYYKWIRENVDSKLYSDSSFITILVTV